MSAEKTFASSLQPSYSPRTYKGFGIKDGKRESWPHYETCSRIRRDGALWRDVSDAIIEDGSGAPEKRVVTIHSAALPWGPLWWPCAPGRNSQAELQKSAPFPLARTCARLSVALRTASCAIRDCSQCRPRCRRLHQSQPLP